MSGKGSTARTNTPHTLCAFAGFSTNAMQMHFVGSSAHGKHIALVHITNEQKLMADMYRIHTSRNLLSCLSWLFST
jgi:hypothetical protein